MLHNNQHRQGSVAAYNGQWVDVNIEFGLNTGTELAYGSQAIKLRIKNLILCSMKSMPYNRGLGSRVLWMMYEDAGSPDLDELRESLYQSIRKYIPEVEVDRANSKVSNTAEGIVIYLRYREKDSNVITDYQVSLSGKMR